MIKYDAKITAIGELTSEFLDHNIVVLFGESAPEELHEFSIIHDGKSLNGQVVAGDCVSIGDQSFQILAVGEVANQNLANLGHLVIKFNGQPEPELPGDVCVEQRPLPQPAVGMRVTIKTK